MKNVKIMNKESLTPTLLNKFIAEYTDNYRSMFVVGIEKNGEPMCHYTGDIRDMSFAHAFLGHILLREFRNEVMDEA